MLHVSKQEWTTTSFSSVLSCEDLLISSGMDVFIVRQIFAQRKHHCYNFMSAINGLRLIRALGVFQLFTIPNKWFFFKPTIYASTHDRYFLVLLLL